MRSDYMLYVVAIIFFILTGTVVALSIEQQQLWIVTTAVLGLVFIGIGYTQRPKQSTSTMTTTPTVITPTTANVPPPPTPSPKPMPVETVKEETVPIVEATPPTPELMKVKGIGEKRAAQLKALGINTIEDLTNASAKDLATKLQISPKITGKWIENAKGIDKKP